MYKYLLAMLVASFMALSNAATAEDQCDTLGNSPEAGLCQAYCSGMNCDSPAESKATESACRDVATNFSALILSKRRNDVTVGEIDFATDQLHTELCVPCIPPDCVSR